VLALISNGVGVAVAASADFHSLEQSTSRGWRRARVLGGGCVTKPARCSTGVDARPRLSHTELAGRANF